MTDGIETSIEEEIPTGNKPSFEESDSPQAMPALFNGDTGDMPVEARMSVMSRAMPSYCRTSCCGSTSPRNCGAK